MSAHTPAPWKLMHAEHGQHVEIVTNHGHIGLAFLGRFLDGSTGEANARLIAAAPTMLAALRRMVDICGWDAPDSYHDEHDFPRADDPHCDAIRMARAAIAAAEGRES